MIALQRCEGCSQWQYPRRDVCRACLSDHLAEAEHPGTGTALATAVVHRSLDPTWAERLPLQVVTVLLDEGPNLIAFGAAAAGARVRVRTVDGQCYAEALL